MCHGAVLNLVKLKLAYWSVYIYWPFLYWFKLYFYNSAVVHEERLSNAQVRCPWETNIDWSPF